MGTNRRIGNANGLLAPPRRRRPPQHPPPAAPLCARLFRAAQSAAAASPERPGARRSTALHGVGWGWTGAAGWGRGARRDGLQAYLAGRGWHLQIAHQGTLTDWQPGEYVELPRHGIWCQNPAAEPDFLEILLAQFVSSLARIKRKSADSGGSTMT